MPYEVWIALAAPLMQIMENISDVCFPPAADPLMVLATNRFAEGVVSVLRLRAIPRHLSQGAIVEVLQKVRRQEQRHCVIETVNWYENVESRKQIIPWLYSY